MVESIEELRKICQGTDKWPQRRISIYITKFLLRTSITADQVTVLDIIVGFVGSAFLFLRGCLYPFIGALLLQLFIILDLVDGEVARYRYYPRTIPVGKGRNPVSEFLQDILERPIYSLALFGLSFGVYQSMQDATVLILGFSAALFLLLNSLTDLDRERLMTGDSDHMRSFKRMKGSLLFRNTFLNRLIDAAAFVLQTIGVTVIILIGIMIDYAFTFLHYYGFPLPSLNIKYLIILFYGLMYPLLWIVNIFFSVRILDKTQCG